MDLKYRLHSSPFKQIKCLEWIQNISYSSFNISAKTSKAANAWIKEGCQKIITCALHRLSYTSMHIHINMSAWSYLPALKKSKRWQSSWTIQQSQVATFKFWTCDTTCFFFSTLKASDCSRFVFFRDRGAKRDADQPHGRMMNQLGITTCWHLPSPDEKARVTPPLRRARTGILALFRVRASAERITDAALHKQPLTRSWDSGRTALLSLVPAALQPRTVYKREIVSAMTWFSFGQTVVKSPGRLRATRRDIPTYINSLQLT